jgi:hypothetical protein
MACAGMKDTEKEMDKNLRNTPHARRVIEMAL